MPTDTTTVGAFPTTPDTSSDGGSSSAVDTHRTLVIALSAVLSAVALALIVGALLIGRRSRQRCCLPFLSRGVSPIDDDEIATWKTPRGEKTGLPTGHVDAAPDMETGIPSTHSKHGSTSSVKKPASVIVYSTPHGQGQGLRRSTDADSQRSFGQNHPVYGKTSFEKALIQARAPNSRVGLTDESVPGDEPYLPSPKRSTSRLSKFPPNSASHRRPHHRRAGNLRRSTRSLGDYYGAWPGSAGSDMGLSPRHSHDHLRHSRSVGCSSHSRVYSSSSVPPRLSLGDEALFTGFSPGRPMPRGHEIGRAIG